MPTLNNLVKIAGMKAIFVDLSFNFFAEDFVLEN